MTYTIQLTLHVSMSPELFSKLQSDPGELFTRLRSEPSIECKMFKQEWDVEPIVEWK